MARLPDFGQRPSLKNTAPEQRASARAAAPTGGSQGNAGWIAEQAGGTAPSEGRPAAGAGYCEPAVWQEASADPRHGGLTRRVGSQRGFDVLVRYDRHMMAKTGTEMQSAHPGPTGTGFLNKLADGPVRPSFMQVNRAHYYRNGTTATRHQDNLGPFAATQSGDGRKQPLGQQDGTTVKTYGGARGLTHIYGVRGPAGAVGPELGSPLDSPRDILSGEPHGIHSPSQPDQLLHAKRARKVPQQRRRTASYPANSKVAGQSYSQTVMPLGGHPAPIPTITTRAPGMRGRGVRRG